MEKNNWKIVYFIILLSMLKCTTSPLSLRNNNYDKAKIEFAAPEFKKLNLTNHFPKKLINNNFSFETSYVSLSCENHNGYFFLICKKTDYQLEFNKSKLNNCYTSFYSSNNTIINLTDLKNNYFPVKKCNVFITNTVPVPYFEDINFNLGYKTIKEKINGDTLYCNVYNIPSDLKNYVLKAEAKNFWNKECIEREIKSLKIWRHGYSKGIAVSDKEDLIVFWSMIW